MNDYILLGLTIYVAINADKIFHNLRKTFTRFMITNNYIDIEPDKKIAKNTIVFMASSLEYLNREVKNGYNLDGWGESIMENIDDYDGVIERLIVESITGVKEYPYIELVFAFVSSLHFHHLAETMFPNHKETEEKVGELFKEFKKKQTEKDLSEHWENDLNKQKMYWVLRELKCKTENASDRASEKIESEATKSGWFFS